MKNKKGFTLAELLAVVIIVALMTMFSVGSYNKSRKQACFTEVLNTANAQAEAYNQRYTEYSLQGYMLSQMPSSGENAVKTAAVACRISDSSSSCYKNADEDYCVEVTTDFAPVRGRIACVGTNENGKAFCESMGYKICTTGNAAGKTDVSVCTK